MSLLHDDFFPHVSLSLWFTRRACLCLMSDLLVKIQCKSANLSHSWTATLSVRLLIVEGLATNHVYERRSKTWDALSSLGDRFTTRTTCRGRRGNEGGWKHLGSVYSFRWGSLPWATEKDISAFSEPESVSTHCSAYNHLKLWDVKGWTWMCQWVTCNKKMLGTDIVVASVFWKWKISCLRM